MDRIAKPFCLVANAAAAPTVVAFTKSSQIIGNQHIRSIRTRGEAIKKKRLTSGTPSTAALSLQGDWKNVFPPWWKGVRHLFALTPTRSPRDDGVFVSKIEQGAIG